MLVRGVGRTGLVQVKESWAGYVRGGRLPTANCLRQSRIKAAVPLTKEVELAAPAKFG